MEPLNDISTVEDIKILVDTFYSKVQKDDFIGSIFNEKIGNRWPEHLEKMYRFWQTILLEVHLYSGSPFPPHKQLAINKEHFDRWMEIFTQTTDSLFTGLLANEAKLRAKNMAEMFNYKIEYLRNAEKNQTNHLESFPKLSILFIPLQYLLLCTN